MRERERTLTDTVPRSTRVYPAMRVADQLRTESGSVCVSKSKTSPKHLARHLTTIALTLREDRLRALLVVSAPEDTIARLVRNRQAIVSPVEARKTDPIGLSLRSQCA